MSIIQTFAGLPFDVLKPVEQKYSILDIAHSLAMQARFTGHGKTFLYEGE